MFGITPVLPRKKPVMPVVEPLTAFTGTFTCAAYTAQLHAYILPVLYIAKASLCARS